jgi:hypothetical protein
MIQRGADKRVIIGGFRDTTPGKQSNIFDDSVCVIRIVLFRVLLFLLCCRCRHPCRCFRCGSLEMKIVHFVCALFPAVWTPRCPLR